MPAAANPHWLDRLTLRLRSLYGFTLNPPRRRNRFLVSGFYPLAPVLTRTPALDPVRSDFEHRALPCGLWGRRQRFPCVRCGARAARGGKTHPQLFLIGTPND